MEKSAGFAVALATRIQRAPNGSALPTHSSELPTQPKAWNAPKTRWLRHPLTEKRAGFAVALATRIQRAQNGSALLRSHSSELPTQPKAWNPSRYGSFRADCVGFCIAGAQYCTRVAVAVAVAVWVAVWVVVRGGGVCAVGWWWWWWQAPRCGVNDRQ